MCFVQCICLAACGVPPSQVFTDMLASWEIPTDMIHLVLWDNRANVVKALQDALLPPFGCFEHTVHDGILSQREVTDMLLVCCSIVGHF